jgi:Rieske Fe-S protein
LEERTGDDRPQLPPPSLWPVGFAVGIVCLLVGLIVSWYVAAVGAGLALVFGFLWARDVATGRHAAVAPSDEEVAATDGAPPEPDSAERFPRNKFLEGATLGLGAMIGALVTIPPLGLLAASSFEGQSFHNINLGPISDFPVGKFMITTFLEDPAAGEVSRRTAYIRNNGFLDEVPSFTVLSNRCAHLGCPVQPNGPVETNQKKETTNKLGQVVSKTPVQPAGFGCPCHGGQYDTEGNRTAGPPVRALDRYAFSIVQGNLVIGSAYSVAKVKGTGKDAQIKKSGLHNPGQHVDGPEFWLWPIPEIRA